MATWGSRGSDVAVSVPGTEYPVSFSLYTDENLTNLVVGTVALTDTSDNTTPDTQDDTFLLKVGHSYSWTCVLRPTAPINYLPYDSSQLVHVESGVTYPSPLVPD